jgi:hypothetical protein
MNININSKVFKKTINQWEFITLFSKRIRVTSKFSDIEFYIDGISIFFEKEAHHLDLDDIAKLIRCERVFIGKDTYGNNMICCL